MPASNVKVMHSNSRRFRNVFQHKKVGGIDSWLYLILMAITLQM